MLKSQFYCGKTMGYDKSSKFDWKQRRKITENVISKQHNKNYVCSYAFRVKDLPESSSCVGVVMISRKGPHNAD